MLQDLFFLLFAWVGLHGALSPCLVSSLACELFGLLISRSANSPIELTEDVGFDCIYTVWAENVQPLDPPAC